MPTVFPFATSGSSQFFGPGPYTVGGRQVERPPRGEGSRDSCLARIHGDPTCRLLLTRARLAARRLGQELGQSDPFGFGRSLLRALVVLYH
jgi:hypothetical protein